MKNLILSILLLFSGVIEANEQDDLTDYKILITSFADHRSSAKIGTNEFKSNEEFAAAIAEQVALMLYRVVPGDIKVNHSYQFKKPEFYWKDKKEHKAVCDTERADAILLTLMEFEESYSYKRDLYIKWFDCHSEDIWEEKIPVEQGSYGWDVQKEVFKYLYFTVPYYLG